jgi:hypothetical protein
VVNARQAAPIFIAIGDPVIALGGFTGRDPILIVDGFARLVDDHQVRFAWSVTAAPACDASSEKTAKSPWSTGSKKKEGSSIPLGGGPRRPMAPMAAAPRKGSRRSSTICVLLTMATDDHPSGL